VQPGESRERKAESRNWGVLVVSLTARESAGCRSLGSDFVAGLVWRRRQARPPRRLGKLEGGPLRAVVAAWGGIRPGRGFGRAEVGGLLGARDSG